MNADTEDDTMQNTELLNLANTIRAKIAEMNDLLPKRQAIWEELQQLHLEAEEKGLRFNFHFPDRSSKVGDAISIGRMDETVTY